MKHSPENFPKVMFHVKQTARYFLLEFFPATTLSRGKMNLYAEKLCGIERDPLEPFPEIDFADHAALRDIRVDDINGDPFEDQHDGEEEQQRFRDPQQAAEAAVNAGKDFGTVHEGLSDASDEECADFDEDREDEKTDDDAQPIRERGAVQGV